MRVSRTLYAMFTADRELEAGFSLKFQPVKRRGLARRAAMISPEDRERLMCRWRGIEAAAVCEVYNLIRVPHGRPQNTECSSRGRDRPLLRPHIAALIIRLYRITLAYHRRARPAVYESIRSVSLLSLSLCAKTGTQRTFWSRPFILDLFSFDSVLLFFWRIDVFLKEKRDFWRDFGLLLRKGFANVRRDMTFLHLILEKIDLKINDRNFVKIIGLPILIFQKYLKLIFVSLY